MLVDLVYYGTKIHFKHHTIGNENHNGPGFNNQTYNPELMSKSALTVMYILGILIISPYLYILTFHNETVSEFPWWSEFKLYFFDLLQHVVCSLVVPFIHVAANKQMRKFLCIRFKNFYKTHSRP